MIVDDAQKVLDHQDVFACCYSRSALLVKFTTTPRLLRTEITQNCGQCRRRYYGAGALTAPGKQGADIVFGSAQRFAYRWVTVAHTRHSLRRKTNTTLNAGPYYRCIERCSWQHRSRMAMQTREQHIRREKANSNIVLPRCCWQTSPACMPFITAGWPETYR